MKSNLNIIQIISLTWMILMMMRNTDMVNGISRVQLNNDGEYSDIVIGIHEDVPYSSQLIDKIKEKFTNASQVLETATRRKGSMGLIFKSITVVVPQSWSNITTMNEQINKTTWETYESADIKIDTNSHISPSTMRALGCRKSGIAIRMAYSHLTDEVKTVKDHGIIEKLIIQNWAQYRWGVFPEYPTEEFYVENNKWEATRCSKSITGGVKSESFSTGSGQGTSSSSCTTDDVDNRPNSYCKFDPDKNQNATASLMYTSKLDNVVHFCDHDTSNPNKLHNRNAPNLQNVKCNDGMSGMSVWEVMREHDDFKSKYNRFSSNPPPIFKFVKKIPCTTVIVMDISGSMREEPIRRLIEAAKIYVKDFMTSDGQLGLVTFATSASILAPLGPLSGNTDFVAKIESLKADGWTALGDGLALGFNMLGGDIYHPESYTLNGQILLISDGEHNYGFREFDDVIDIVSRSKATVHTISIGDHTDNRMQNLSMNTGGKYLKASSTSTTDLTSEMQSIICKGTSRYRRVETVADGEIDTGENVVISIDKGLIIFVFDLSSSNLRVTVTSPSGKVFNSNNNTIYELSRDGRNVIIRIPEIDAEFGNWTIGLSSVNNRRKRSTASGNKFVVFVDGDKANVEMTGDVDCGIISTPTSSTRCPTYVVITNNERAVLNAKVTLIITSPNNRKIEVPMLDDGQGSDMIKNDGIYSAVFMGADIEEEGIYSLKASAQIKPNQSSDEIIHRVQPLGSVKVENPKSSNQNDQFPPDRINDVLVEVVDKLKMVIRVIFVAVGDDGNRGGRASYYELKLDNNTVSNDSLPAPNNPGSKESIVLSLNRILPSEKSGNTLKLSVRAVDNAGNAGQWSFAFPFTFTTPEFSARNDAPPVKKPYNVSGMIGCSDIDQPDRRTRCVTTVRIDHADRALLTANVTMTLIRPDSTSLSIEMFDYESGSDNVSSDANYSASIIGYYLNTKGIYIGRAEISLLLESSEIFKEIIPLGTFECINDPVDNFPPNQIRIIQHKIINTSVTIEFYAVGDDGDRFTASYYEIKINDRENRKLSHPPPNTAGRYESVTISLNDEMQSLAIRAVDKTGNAGQWSKTIRLVQNEKKKDDPQDAAVEDYNRLQIILIGIFVPVTVLILITAVGIIYINYRNKQTASGF